MPSFNMFNHSIGNVTNVCMSYVLKHNYNNRSVYKIILSQITVYSIT